MSAPWGDSRTISAFLSEKGWVTPDTYVSSEFKPITGGPAVYLFLLYERDDYRKALVAYVGQSTRLTRRLEGHSILAMLEQDNTYVSRWFLPTARDDLRAVEMHYIRHFDPPWNIVGRRRGLQ